jgi:hypothetical protein
MEYLQNCIRIRARGLSLSDVRVPYCFQPTRSWIVESKMRNELSSCRAVESHSAIILTSVAASFLSNTL